MPNNTNPASRVHSLCSKAAAQTSGSIADVWSRVFELKQPAKAADISVVARRLALLSEEIDEAERLMRATQYSPDLFEAPLNRVRTALGFQQLAKPWEHVRGSLDTGTLQLIKFCSEVLPDEERVVSDDLRNELVAYVENFRRYLESADIPAELASFILRQLAIIERALTEYPIAGIRALRRAVAELAVEADAHEELVYAHRSHEAVGRLRKAWSSFAALARSAEMVDKLLTAGIRVIDVLRGAADAIGPGQP